MDKTPAIPLHEHFFAFQGEGDHMGRSAYFLRTFGCPVHCPWCDSAGTWHKDWIPKAVERFTPSRIVELVRPHVPEFVVLTGGEPSIQPTLSPLVGELHMAGFPVHIETCGGFRFDTSILDWITVSPKWDKLPTRENLLACHEIKMIVDEEDSILRWIEKLNEITGDDSWAEHKSVWLHPEWSRREDPKILNAISRAVKDGNSVGLPMRAGWQLHKLYQVDTLDPNSKALAPLGGNPALGY